MKVLLIVPTHQYRNERFPVFLSPSDFPSGYGYLTAALKAAGHEVFGLNLNNNQKYKTAYEMLRNEIPEAIDRYQPGLIGIGGLCIDFHCIRDSMEIIRTVAPEIPIVLGGGIVNHDAEFIFETLKPNFIIKGDGEHSIEALANALATRSPLQDAIIEGITGHPDISPFPDYSPFGMEEMVDKYSWATRMLYRYSRPNPRPFIIVTARSCPFHCTFCVHDHGAPYRARSIENIMAEIKESYEKYHFNILLILDELFAVNNQRLRDFCEAVIEGKKQYGWDFDWTFQTHASAKFDLDTLKLAKEAGCYMFSYGLESGSQTILESMGKKTKVEQVVEAIQLAREAKVGFSGNIIFGDPAETDETMAESLSFWLKHGRDAFIFLSYITPYPGSKLFDDLIANGVITDKAEYYEQIDNVMVNMTSMTNRDWQRRLQAAIMLEQGWFFPKATVGRCVAEADGIMQDITATCPHCLETIFYRQPLQSIGENAFLGVGCTKCQSKIRIDLVKA